MSKIIYASPKQTLVLFFEVFNSNQERVAAPTLPIILNVYDPQFELITGYPQNMESVDEGLYSFSFTLPTGPSAVGSYIINIIWEDPDSSLQKQTHYQIVCKSPANAAGQYVAIIPNL